MVVGYKKTFTAGSLITCAVVLIISLEVLSQTGLLSLVLFLNGLFTPFLNGVTSNLWLFWDQGSQGAGWNLQLTLAYS